MTKSIISSKDLSFGPIMYSASDWRAVFQLLALKAVKRIGRVAKRSHHDDFEICMFKSRREPLLITIDTWKEELD
ncbi:hypothetical protein Peur_024262 [Populus x canadensis]